MIRRYPYKKYLLLIGALFLLLSLPPLFISSIRGKYFAFFSPAMKLTSGSAGGSEIRRVEAENHLLRLELAKLRTLSGEKSHFETKAIAARVIYRDPSSWSSSVWVDVGSYTDPIVQKNSPVIVGHALVGVIDYVGKRQARVRLITDVELKPAVRAVRGSEKNRVLLDMIEPLLKNLAHRTDLPLSEEEQKTLGRQLTFFKERLVQNGETSFWAKGILQGAGTPLWRSCNSKLRGVGFNYDFSDEQGEACPLRSEVPIIQVNDLLVTTGLDGVFPSGLAVAQVSKIFPLQEGAYTYSIEATPVVGNLDAIQTLFVISPLGYDVEDQPKLHDGIVEK